MRRSTDELYEALDALKYAGPLWRPAYWTLFRLLKSGEVTSESLVRRVRAAHVELLEELRDPSASNTQSVNEFKILCWLLGPIPRQLPGRKFLAWASHAHGFMALPEGYPNDPPTATKEEVTRIRREVAEVRAAVAAGK